MIGYNSTLVVYLQKSIFCRHSTVNDKGIVLRIEFL